MLLETAAKVLQGCFNVNDMSCIKSLACWSIVDGIMLEDDKIDRA